MLPLGLLYVGGIIERCGHHAKIIDFYLESYYDKNNKKFNYASIEQIIDDFKPDVIGFGGIATSYGTTKKLSSFIKEKNPKIVQIAGGALSSVYKLLLTKAKIDAVFHGESESNLPVFLRRVKSSEPFHDVHGISYLKDGEVVRNIPVEQIKNLDEISFPAYHLVDVQKYLNPIRTMLDTYFKQLITEPALFECIKKNIGNKTHYIPIVTSRGCTHRCSFCYRHMQGIRQHSVDYVIRHIKFLQTQYDIKGFQFCDELFNSRKDWVMEFCDAIEKNNLDIFYIIGGARIDKMDDKMLQRLQETGCINIDYGQESGSDTILKEYRKGITVQQNKDVTLLTKRKGIFTTVQIVFGSPSETRKTIYETIQFLKDVNAFDYSPNYLIPLPETPIWKYVEDNKLVMNIEKYLDEVAEYGGGKLIVNLTGVPNREVKKWNSIIQFELILHYFNQTNQQTKYAIFKYFKFIFINKNNFFELLPHPMRKIVNDTLKNILFT